MPQPEYATLRDLTSLENAVDLKLENIRINVNTANERGESALRGLTTHEGRLDALEGKDLVTKAGRYDKAMKWAIGVMVAATATWIFMNWNSIMTFFLAFQPKGGQP